MKFLFRTLAAVFATCLIVLIGTFTVRFIKRAWFGLGYNTARVAVMDLSGVIWGSTSFLKLLDETTEDKSIKAIVVRINSPGGLVGPSQELYEGIKRADAKVPVFVSMGALAASGGYYAALGGRQIFASPGTLTGSIGVIMEFVNTQKLYQWAKVERYTLKAGKFKDIGSPMRNMTPEEKELMSNMANEIHGQFKQAVKERRNLTDQDIETLTDGRILTGSQAFRGKLVDSLGGFHEALKAARAAGELPESAPVEYLGERGSWLKRLILGEEDPSSQSFLSRLILALDPQRTVDAMPGFRVLLLAPLS